MATAAATPIHATAGFRSPFEYWHLLSLDAPTVAILWAYAFCRAVPCRFDVATALFLGLGTWLVYATDRILDGSARSPLTALRERHRFHRQHRSAFLWTTLPVACVLLALTLRYLPRPMLRSFSLIMLATTVYFALVHIRLPLFARYFPKKLLVGLIFAWGVSVPAWSRLAQLPGTPREQVYPLAWITVPTIGFVAAVALFAALCWLDCVAIDEWEQTLDRAADQRDGEPPPSTTRRPTSVNFLHPWRSVRTIASLLAAAALLLCILERVAPASTAPSSTISSHHHDSPLFFFVAASAAVFWLLDGLQDHLSPQQLRIAADAALLTPLMLLMMPHL